VLLSKGASGSLRSTQSVAASSEDERRENNTHPELLADFPLACATGDVSRSLPMQGRTVPQEFSMNNLKSLLKASALAAIVAAGATIALSSAASAEIVCNRDGDCWHTAQRYTEYPTTLGVQFYSDDWRDAHRADTHYHWRDDPKDDHGYYEGSEWHAFGPDHH
jgi:hypothetical protein